jgi:hypothetical protein
LVVGFPVVAVAVRDWVAVVVFFFDDPPQPLSAPIATRMAASMTSAARERPGRSSPMSCPRISSFGSR